MNLKYFLNIFFEYIFWIFRVNIHFLSQVRKKHDLLRTVPVHPFQLKPVNISGIGGGGRLACRGWTWLWWVCNTWLWNMWTWFSRSTSGACCHKTSPATTQPRSWVEMEKSKHRPTHWYLISRTLLLVKMNPIWMIELFISL